MDNSASDKDLPLPSQESHRPHEAWPVVQQESDSVHRTSEVPEFSGEAETESEAPEHEPDQDELHEAVEDNSEFVKEEKAKETQREKREEQLEGWEETIEHMNFWSTACEARLLGLETLLERIFAEVTELTNEVEHAANEIAVATFLTARIANWNDLMESAEQQVDRAKQWAKRSEEGLVIGGLLAGWLVFAAGATTAAVVTSKK